MFRVGQKVVCVRSGGTRYHGIVREGNIYTIRDIGDDGDPRGPWVRLCEVRNKTIDAMIWNGTMRTAETVYSATRFRPIVERKTDIAIFKKMLLPASKERVDVRS